MNYLVKIGPKQLSTSIEEKEGSWHIQVGKKSFVFSLLHSAGKTDWCFEHQNQPLPVTTFIQDEKITLWLKGEKISAAIHQSIPTVFKQERREALRSIMPGLIRQLKVKERDRVTQSQSLLVLEAMKMENEILSPISGIIEKIFVQENQSVEGNALLLEIKPQKG